MVHVSNHPLIRHKLALLRNRATGSADFRRMVSELTVLLTYEATMDLKVRPATVETPVTGATVEILAETIGLVPILRAGLGMVDGVWHVLSHAEVWHIG